MLRHARLGLALLALVGATPAPAAGPTIRGGPAPLLRDASGPQLATLAAGTSLTLNSASCEQGATWVDVTVGDRVGWVSVDLIDFGAGVPLALAAWAGQAEVRDAPLGAVRAVLAPDAPFAAGGVACGSGRAWIRVKAGDVEGWLPGSAVLFRPGGQPLP